MLIEGRVEVDVWNFNEPVLLDEPPIKTEMDPVSFNTDLPFWHGLEKLKGRKDCISINAILVSIQEDIYSAVARSKTPIRKTSTCPETSSGNAQVCSSN